MIDAPTGTGKTIVGMVAAKSSNRAVYLCTTKILQDQLIKDFPNIPILKGRSNYPCNYSKTTRSAFPEFTAEDCPRQHLEGSNKKKDSFDDEGDGSSCSGRCLYMIAKKIALKSSICILNTSYFLAECNFIGQFSKVPLLVVDEVDRLEDELLRFVEVTISQRTLNYLNLPAPKYKTKFESWKEWAEACLPIILTKISELTKSIESDTTNSKILRLLSTLKSMSWKMIQFINNVDSQWVFIDKTTSWTFKPIWVDRYCKDYFFDHITTKILMMSATILSPDRMGRTLGLTRLDWDYISIPSQFPVDNRKVYYYPVANITRASKEEELPKLIPAIQKIMKYKRNEKGLIHTVSYSNAKYLIDNLGSDRLITHDGGNREATLEKFKQSDQPLILISPSMERGVDLPYDACRWVILIKVLYPSLEDKQISARVYGSKFGRSWYLWTTACNIVQATGRAVRAVDDSAMSWILDKQFGKFYGENSELFPVWWKEALVFVDEN